MNAHSALASLALCCAMAPAVAKAGTPPPAAPPLKVVVLPALTNSPLYTMALPQERKHDDEKIIANLNTAADFVARSRPQFEVVATITRDELTADDAMFQHYVLLDVLLADIGQRSPKSGTLAPEKSKYIAGPGLAALGAKHGVRHALLVRLEDPRMSPGRTAGELISAAIGFWASGGTTFVMAAPRPRLTAAVIDLTDGRIVWAQDRWPIDGGLNADDLYELVDDGYCKYPYANRIGSTPRQLLRPCNRDIDYDKKTGTAKWDD